MLDTCHTMVSTAFLLEAFILDPHSVTARLSMESQWLFSLLKQCCTFLVFKFIYFHLYLVCSVGEKKKSSGISFSLPLDHCHFWSFILFRFFFEILFCLLCCSVLSQLCPFLLMNLINFWSVMNKFWVGEYA